MIHKHSLAVFALAFLPWTARAQDAKAILADAAKAMGVEDLNSVGSFMYLGAGATFQFGAARKPEAPWPKSTASSYRRVIDFDAGGSLETITRPPGENGAEKDALEILRIPFREKYGEPGRQYEIWITPLAFLKGAAKGNATVKPVVVAGKQYNAVSFAFEKYKITGYIDRENLLTRVETRIDNPVLGDMLVESLYSDYKDFQHGLTFPSRIVEKQGGYPVLDLTITNAVRNAIEVVIEPVRHFDRGIGDPHYHGPFLGAPPPITVDQTLLAEDVYSFQFRIENEGKKEDYRSLLVEFKDYLVVIEAPLDEAHSKVALQEIRKLFGNKPIRYVVNTHAHFDAAGGLRAYAAQGAAVITQEINKPYFEKVFALPRTVNQDRPTPAKKRFVIEGVAEKRVITDGTHVIELHHVQNESADGMLIAYLPKEGLVYEADLYIMPDPDHVITENGEVLPVAKPPVTPYAAALANSLDHLKIDFQTIVGIQGRPASREEFLEDVKTLLTK